MNTITYYKNLLKNVYFMNIKSKFFKKETTLNKEETTILDELKENGVAVVPNFFTEEECDQLILEIDCNIEKYSDTIWRDDLDSDNRIYNAEEISSLFKKFHDNKFIKRLAEAYLNSEVIIASTLTNRTKFKKGNKGSGGGWHRDTPYRNQFKSVAYLIDVNDENGPFSYYLGSHKTTNNQFEKVKGIRNYDYRVGKEEFLESVSKNGFKYKKFTAKKGTLLLLDTKGIHRGTPLKSGMRYTIFNYIFPKYEFKKGRKNVFNKLKVLR